MHSVAFEDNRVIWQSVHTESSQESFCYGAEQSVKQFAIIAKSRSGETLTSCDSNTACYLSKRSHLWCRCVHPPGQSRVDIRS